jgi:hypothetical protein
VAAADPLQAHSHKEKTVSNASKTLLAVLAGVAAIAVILVVSYYGGIIGNHVQANYNARVVGSKVKQQVNTAEFARTSYEHFYDACASVQSLDQKLDEQYNELKTATGDDKTRIETNVGGLVGARADAVTQYNADARKDWTLAVFKASDLPYQLPIRHKKGEITSCNA